MYDEQAIAHHEAAHGCFALLAGWPVRAVSIVPAKDSAGHCLPETKPGEREDVDWVPYLLAGGAAERQLTGRPATLDSSDLEVARTLLSVMRHHRPDAEPVEAALKAWAFVADFRVRQHWPWIERVARELRRARVLTGAQVAALYRP